MRRQLAGYICTLGIVLGGATANAQFAIFNEGSDGIEVSGQTEVADQITIEAVLRLPATAGAAGTVFNEWAFAAEDKALGVGPTSVLGLLFPLPGGLFQIPVDVAPDEWHHVVYQYDGAAESFYLDGILLDSRANSGAVSNSPGPGYVGAIPRDGTCAPSFVGDLDSLRVSRVARYSGDSFTPTIGDLVSDEDTLLLYNFDDAPGSATVVDSGPLGRTGTLGAGCGGIATKPQLGVCADPAPVRGAITATDALATLQAAVGLATCELCICDVDGSGAVTATDALFTLTAAVGQPVSLDCPLCGGS